MTLKSFTLGWTFTFLLCFTLFNGTWGDCSPPKRDPYAEPENALDPKTFPPNATISYICRPGYVRLRGLRNSITCLEDGTWSTLDSICTRKSCGNPGEVLNGNMDATDFLFGSNVTYTCNVGFRLSNKRNVRECLADGSWSNVLPQCDEVICPAPESPANGQYEPQKDEYTYLDSVRFSCQKPLEVAGNSSISCTETGMWSSDPPTCKVVNCPDPVVGNSVRLSGFVGPYTLNNGISFKCKDGFVLNGSSSISCNIDSQWVPAIPQCEPVNCPNPEVKNSRMSEFTGPHTLNSVISVQCNKGFVLNGPSSITCNIDNQWVPSIPKCERRSCGHHGTIPNGQVSVPPKDFHVGSKAFYTCNEGYKMKTNQDFKECQEDGTWSSEIVCIGGSEGLSVGAIVGIVIGLVGGAALGIVLYICLCKKQKRGETQTDTPVQYSQCNA